MQHVLFDESLGLLVEAVSQTLGEAVLERGVILRDATGFLCFVSADPAPREGVNEAINIIRHRLEAYGRPDRVLIFLGDPGAQSLLADQDRLGMVVGTRFCWVIDRRIVGSGWLAAPSSKIAKPPRIVFASLKGGVGRSTALALAASDLAMRGRNVLAIDLDLEAPGLSDLLLTPERMPRYGVVDYLVETKIDTISEDLLNDFIGLSPLTIGTSGRVDVVPAFGTRSNESPENMLPKLARAMIENFNLEGEIQSIGVQISNMIDRLSTRDSYDVILIDSRAGLGELTAPAVLGLGALVLLFGTAQQQTISGYRALFAALKLLALRADARRQTSDWRLMFKPVYAKASLDARIAARHADEIYEIFAENLYNPSSGDDQLDTIINFAIDDPDAPHALIVIPLDPRFVDFDPVRNQSHLAQTFYEQTFRPFLNDLDRAIENLNEAPERRNA